MTSRRIVLLWVSLGLLASACGGTGASSQRYTGPPARWEQARVTGIATDLRSAAEELRNAFIREPQRTIGSGQEASYYRLKQIIRRLRSEANQLVTSLEAGENREQTYPIFQSLRVMVRDAEENGRRIFASDQLLTAATRAGDAMIRLAPYYQRPVDG